MAWRPARYLALRPGQAHGREALASLLWGDTDDAHARKSLRQAVYVLRKALPAARPPILAAALEDVGRGRLEEHYAALALHAREGEQWDRAARYLYARRACVFFVGRLTTAPEARWAWKPPRRAMRRDVMFRHGQAEASR